MDILCVGHIMSYLTHNVRPIFHIYSLSVSDWCSTSKKSGYQANRAMATVEWGTQIENYVLDVITNLTNDTTGDNQTILILPKKLLPQQPTH